MGYLQRAVTKRQRAFQTRILQQLKLLVPQTNPSSAHAGDNHAGASLHAPLGSHELSHSATQELSEACLGGDRYQHGAPRAPWLRMARSRRAQQWGAGTETLLPLPAASPGLSCYGQGTGGGSGPSSRVFPHSAHCSLLWGRADTVSTHQAMQQALGPHRICRSLKWGGLREERGPGLWGL